MRTRPFLQIQSHVPGFVKRVLYAQLYIFRNTFLKYLIQAVAFMQFSTNLQSSKTIGWTLQ